MALQGRIKTKSHLELGRLLALRDLLVRNTAGLKGTLKEMKVLLSSPTTDTGCIILKRSIDYKEKQVKSIEDRIKEIISADTSMSKNYELLTSLKGIGLVVACKQFRTRQLILYVVVLPLFFNFGFQEINYFLIQFNTFFVSIK